MPQVRIKSNRTRMMPKIKPQPRPLRPTTPRQPLTHHEILALMAPFSQRGLHADMAASRREDRILAFQPQQLPADDACPVPLSVQLVLEAGPGGQLGGRHRLVRHVRDETGLESRLTADGADLEILLEQLDQVPVRRQFSVHADIPVARTYVLESVAEARARRAGAEARRAAQTVGGRLLQGLRSRTQGLGGDRLRALRERLPGQGVSAPKAAAATEQMPEANEPEAAEEELLIDTPNGPLRPVIVEGAAQVGPVHLLLKADRFNGSPVELKLTTEAGGKLKVPEDLLAVIDWHHRPLREIVSYWRGSIRVSPEEPARTPEIERELGRTVEHLAQTLAEPPARFHERYAGARWRVAYQRAVPMLVLLGIMAASPGIRYVEFADDSILKMLIFHAPPMMLIIFFLMREMPRFEIPPLPRPLSQRSWIRHVRDKHKPDEEGERAAAGLGGGLDQPRTADAEG